MAHELGHLVGSHHGEGLPQAERDRDDAFANAFAAELLLPRAQLASVTWDQLDAAGLAELIWLWGVSTDALARRLGAVTGFQPEIVRAWAGQPTQRLLRQHRVFASSEDEITIRMDAAARRRFPIALQEAHLRGIAAGTLGRGTLAWMLGIDPESLDVDAPTPPEVNIDDLAGALGL